MHYVSREEADPIMSAIELDAKLATYKRRMLVYLSGKYRDVDEHSVDCNIQHAKRVAADLWKMGYAVICPHANSQHMGFKDDGGCFLEGDMVMVERSDLLVMLPNWESSEGAQLERRLAMTLRVPVYYWDVHCLALARIATNDHRFRSACAAILGRADRIAAVTGYHPRVEHVAPAPTEEVCGSCGTPRGAGQSFDEYFSSTKRSADLAGAIGAHSSSATAI